MTEKVKPRQPSPLQRGVLTLLGALSEQNALPVRTRDVERMLAQGTGKPVYGPSLRESCKRMEKAGWLRTLRASNLQLAVELTEAGSKIAATLLASEREAELTQHRRQDVRVLPVCYTQGYVDKEVVLDGNHYRACRADYVIKLDSSTCLQLWRADGKVQRFNGDPLQIANYLEACYEAGLSVRVQVNESRKLDEGTPFPERA